MSSDWPQNPFTKDKWYMLKGGEALTLYSLQKTERIREMGEDESLIATQARVGDFGWVLRDWDNEFVVVKYEEANKLIEVPFP